MPRPPSSRPPRPRPPKPGPEPHARGRRSAALDVGAIERALVEVVPDPRDRSFVLRCIVEEGPRHHRVASWALLRLLASLLDELGGEATLSELPAEPLRMRLPPSVVRSRDDAEFPIGLPTRMLEEVLGDEGAVAAAVECLRDGPPHHALANATMVWLIEAIAERARALAASRAASK